MYIETSFVLYMLLYICTCIYMLLFICHTHHADLLSVQYSDFTMCGVCPLTSICTYVTRKCTILVCFMCFWYCMWEGHCANSGAIELFME